MREIKFRGKSKLSVEELDSKEMKHTDGWIIGNLIVNGNLPLIVGDLADYDEEYITHEQWCSVHPETVGQYTGLKDKNGAEIYEGDIITSDANFIKGKLIYRYGSFQIKYGREKYRSLINATYPVVIGNIYENPELLENADN